MADIIQTHRMTNLVSTSNPVLADGELIYNEVSKDLRIGDDATAYNSLDRLDMCGGVLPWKSILTFAANEVVVYSGTLYKSLQAANLNKTPSSEPTWWEAIGSGSFSSPLTTKGDLLAFSTADARLPVGTDGQVLAADSSEALGVKWADAGSGSGHVIQDDGTGLTQRTNLNFIGFDVSDDSGNDATKIELPAASQVQTAMVKVSEEVITTAKTAHSFTGLDGNTDKRYIVKARCINTVAGNVGVIVDINGDTAANYSFQYFYTSGTSLTAGQSTGNGLWLFTTRGSGYVAQGEITIDAKSGTYRQCRVDQCDTKSPNIAAHQTKMDYFWHNSADNITQVNVTADTTNGLGVGTIIELWAEREVGGGSTASSSAPASASSAGVAGTLAYDSSYLYVCTATDTWQRAALSTWS